MQESRNLMLVPLLLFSLLIAVDVTGIILAVPNITASLQGNATESFWIGASFLLAMCISQPTLSNLSYIFKFKSLVLSSITILGTGSLICDYGESMLPLLLGRSIQGLGSGGLTVLAYMMYGESGPYSGRDYLTAINCFVATGTICGPIIGAIWSDGTSWRWLFRLNTSCCVVLGALVYSSRDITLGVSLNDVQFLDVDLLGSALFITSVVPLLIGLSFIGSLYRWSDWQSIVPIALGGALFILFAVREFVPSLIRLRATRMRAQFRPFLGLGLLKDAYAVVTFAGAIFLGVLMYALLFFLPIYFRVIKNHSKIHTALLLLPQTAFIPACAFFVRALDKRQLSARWIVILGWLCTSGGAGLLAMLGTDKTVTFDILLNLLSGFGLGILLPGLVLGAKECSVSSHSMQMQTLLVTMRYFGSAFGLVMVGMIFQHLLRLNLASTMYKDEAANMTKHATTLMLSIQEMPDSEGRQVLVRATEDALCNTWIGLSIICLGMFLWSSIVAVVTAYRARVGANGVTQGLGIMEEDEHTDISIVKFPAPSDDLEATQHEEVKKSLG